MALLKADICDHGNCDDILGDNSEDLGDALLDAAAPCLNGQGHRDGWKGEPKQEGKKDGGSDIKTVFSHRDGRREVA